MSGVDIKTHISGFYIYGVDIDTYLSGTDQEISGVDMNTFFAWSKITCVNINIISGVNILVV